MRELAIAGISARFTTQSLEPLHPVNIIWVNENEMSFEKPRWTNDADLGQTISGSNTGHQTPQVEMDSSKVRVGSALLGTIISSIVFGGFGLCFAAFGVYAMVQSYPKQGRVAVIGGSVFISFGLGLAALVVFACISHLRDVRRAAADPSSPWLWSGAWKGPEIADHPFGGAVGVWIIALIWNGLVGAACWGILSSTQTLQPGEAILLVFVAIGLYLLVIAVRATLRDVRYGRTKLHLTTLPGEIGGHLAGILQTERPIQAIGPARLRLICQRVTSDNRHSFTSTVWETTLEIQNLQTTASGTEIPFDFEIPAELPATRQSSSTRDAIHWKLGTTVAAEGVNYASNFEVPIFDVRGIQSQSASDFSFPPPETNIASTLKTVEPPVHPGIVLSRLADGGCTIHFAAARNWLATIIWTIIGAGLSYGLVCALRMHGDWVLIIWLMIFAIPFDFAALSGWLSSSTVIARRSGLHVDSGWPLIRSHKDIAAESITDITDEVSTQAGNTKYYRLAAKTSGGQDVSLAGGIRDLAVARWVAAELLRSLHKSKSSV